MHDRLEDLINRLEAVVGGDDRPVQLHWSDVQTLRALAQERRELDQKVQALGRSITRTLGGLLEGSGVDHTSPFQVRQPLLQG